MKNLFIISILSLGLSNSVLAEKVTHPVVNNMILQFGNYAQQVEVRAKSLSPSTCSVTFNIAGKSNGFLAPPLAWSPWTKLDPAFLSNSTQKLGFTVNCDTGALAEIKYHK